MNTQMRATLTIVASPPAVITTRETLSHLQRDTAALEVRQEYVRPRVGPDDDVIAGRVPDILLSKRIVGKIRDDGDHHAFDRSENRLVPRVEVLEPGRVVHGCQRPARPDADHDGPSRSADSGDMMRPTIPRRPHDWPLRPQWSEWQSQLPTPISERISSNRSAAVS